MKKTLKGTRRRIKKSKKGGGADDIPSLNKTKKKIVDFAKKGFDVKKKFTDTKEGLNSNFKDAKNNLIDNKKGIIDKITNTKEGLNSNFKDATGFLNKEITNTKEGLNSNFKDAKNGLINAKEGITGKISNTKEGLKTKDEGFLSSLKENFSKMPFFGNNNTEEFQGSDKGEYLNENYRTELPYVKEYIPELTKEKIEEKIKKDKEKVRKAEADYKESKKLLKKEKEEKFIEKENDKKIELQKFTANLASKDAYDLRNFLTLAAIMTFIATSSKETISKFIDVLGEILPLMLRIINSDIIIKHIIPMAIIIGTVLFIMYIMGFKVNIGNTSSGTINNNPNIKIAENKPTYNNSETIYDNIMKIIMSIPGLKNIFANYKDIRSRLTNTLSGVDTLQEYSIDRHSIKTGRNDNIYNIKLAKYFGKTDNDIYSIIAPADLEIKYEDNKDLLIDLNILPKSIQDDILKDKKNIKLKWDLENNKYIMRCNNIIDEDGNKVENLYSDCSKKAQNKNNSYDKERERLPNVGGLYSLYVLK